MKLRVLDLFSGIGGFSLGLERARHDGPVTGFETVAFCEIEEFPRRVLAKHWPEAPCYRDVRELTAERLAADGIAVDVITGGFPCQDISTAGRRAGIGQGTRSGLYREVIRLACDIRPKFILLENVAGLLSGPSEQPGQWFGTILGDLASIRYDAEWENIPAAALGAPHRRERVWIIAYPAERNERQANTQGILGARKGHNSTGLSFRGRLVLFGQALTNEWVCGEPPICELDERLSYGLVQRQLQCFGNTVVPQIPELIGNAILQSVNTEALR